MSNVRLTIGGRPYSVACDPGEEEHVAELARMVDAKLAELPGVAALGEVRALLYAALLLAEDARAQASPLPIPAPARDDRLDAIAARLERLAADAERIAS